MRMLLTGANGSIGRYVAPLLARHHQICAGARNISSSLRDAVPAATWHQAPSLGPDADWRPLLQGVDVVVHLAGMAAADRSTRPMLRLRHVNVAGAARLALQAAEVGARRFVYISSIKAETSLDHDADCYGRSKREAESALTTIAAQTSLQLVILRPAPVYGPGTNGGFAALVRCVRRGLPLPFGAIAQRRSYLSVWNLAAVIERCATAAHASGMTLPVADERAISLKELCLLVAAGLGTRARLVAVGPHLLRRTLKVCGFDHWARQLLDPQEIDDTMLRESLGWRPSVTLEQQIGRAARELR